MAPSRVAKSVVFARVGWMTFYDPSRDPDEEPIGGGSYNEEEVGSEAENFRVFGDRLFGYVETRRRGAGLNTRRLGGEADRSVGGVLVIFVAKHPREGRQRIVGWYDNATCHPEAADRSDHRREAYGLYNIEADVGSCVLLPEEQRTAQIPKGRRGTMGQSQTFYADGSIRGPTSDWVMEATAFVRRYKGPSLLSMRATGITARTTLSKYRRANEQTTTRQPEPFSRDPNTLDRALSSHARLQNDLAARARERGRDVVQPGSGMPDFDLGWREEVGFTVVEVKSISTDNESQQLRYGLGQVLDYSDQLQATFARTWPVLAIERSPSDPRWIRLCESLGVKLVWPATFADLFPED